MARTDEVSQKNVVGGCLLCLHPPAFGHEKNALVGAAAAPRPPRMKIVAFIVQRRRYVGVCAEYGAHVATAALRAAFICRECGAHAQRRLRVAGLQSVPNESPSGSVVGGSSVVGARVMYTSTCNGFKRVVGLE